MIAILLALLVASFAATAQAETLPVHWTHPNPDSVTHYLLALGTTKGADDLGIYEFVAPSSEADGTFQAEVQTPTLPQDAVHRELRAANAVNTSVPSNSKIYTDHVPIPEPPVLLNTLVALFVLGGLRKQATR